MFSGSSGPCSLENIIIKEEIYKNAYSEIYEVADKKTDTLYAARVILKDIDDFSNDKMNEFSKDIKTLKQIDHPSIIKYYGCSPNDFNGQPNPVFFTELAKNFAFSHLSDNSSIKYIIIYGIASGMSYLHSHNIIHCNLTLSNILLDDLFHPKITGFNYSKTISDYSSIDSSYRFTRLNGSPEYYAPEVFTKKEFNKSSDIFSFGVILYEILTQKYAYNECSTYLDVMKKILNKKWRPNIKRIPKFYQEIIKKCWSEDPTERPTFDEIIPILKADPNLASDEEYQNYVKFIDESKKSFNSEIQSKENKQIDELLRSKQKKEAENKININNLFTKKDVCVSGKYYDYRSGEKYSVKIIEKKIEDFSDNDFINFSQQIAVTSQLNHPSIKKFHGFIPVNFKSGLNHLILTEVTFGNLKFIREKNLKNIQQWDDTQKLINIYGIACGMSYLHSHNILHRDLKIENIYIDDLFFPKISGFHLSKEIQSNSDKEIFSQIQGTPAFLSPEIYLNKEYSKSSDVYAFSFLVYEILTNEKPFQNFINVHQVYEEVITNKKRPEFNTQVPDCYQKLIEKCWSQEPKDRPTFDEIVNILRTDKSFITNSINEKDFHKYIEMIDKSKISFDPCKKIIIDNKEFRSSKKIQSLYKAGILGIFDTEFYNVSLDLKYVDLNDFEKKEKIGEGAFSKVVRIIDKKTGHNYAAKIFKYELQMMQDHDLLSLSREVNAISKINHPSVVKFIGYSSVNFKNKPRPVIVTEISSNRSLSYIFELIQSNQDVNEWDDTKKLITIYGIASAMSFLHSLNIIHRDLKPENILFDDYMFPKIIDFGFSKSIHDNSNKNSGEIGTFLYMAPEIITNNNYDKPGDVYSFSLIMYQIVTGLKPFATITSSLMLLNEVFNKGARPEFRGSIPQCYKSLIEKCWSQEPNERPTFDEVVEILRTDPNFITEDVNESVYNDFINYIDEVRIEIENHTFNELNDNLLRSKFESFEKVDISSYLDEMNEVKELNIDLNSIDLYEYEKQKFIGRGSFGTVYKVVDKKTKEIYAAKISKTYLNQCTNDDIKNLEREVKIISRLNHPSILKFIGYNNYNFKGKPKPIIITELVTNGSLDEILELERKCRSNSEWNDTKKLINIYGIASAMAYLHSQDILHRDLKPANILLDEYLFPKISDFGLSKYIFEEVDDTQLLSGFKGTYAYSAPEIFQGKYTKAGDVYAFAIIVYEIMTNDVPYVETNPYQLLLQVPNGMRPKFNIGIPKCYQDLIENCWNNDPEKRPTFDEIVDILKTNQEFITDNVDIDDFLNYVDFVDESNKTENRYKSAIEFFESSDIKFVDLNSYKLGELVSIKNIYNEYKLICLKTKEICLGKFWKKSIEILPEDKIIDFKREVKIASQINYPLFTRFIGYSPTDYDHQSHPVVVYEYPSKGTLKNILEKSKLNDTIKLICLYGIAFGMKYLHSNEIIHRNLSTSSVFLDEEFHPKISEFDFVKKISDNFDDDENKAFIGSYSYAAPEVLKCQYSKSGDVYSFAMIAYELMTEKKLYEGLLQYQIINQVSNSERPEINDEIPSVYKDLIEECWSQDQSKRPAFAQIVDRLKSNPEFITEKVDKNEFFIYIEKVEKLHQKIEREIMKDKQLNVQNNENEQTKSSYSKFKKVSVGFESIKSEKVCNDEKELNPEFLDLKKFKLGDLIRKADYSKTYQVISKEEETETVYSAKISTLKMNEFSRDELISLSREVNIISQLRHPSFLKFIGYSPVDFKNKRYPVIVTELASNGTLKNILESERQKIEIKQWDDTTKLINIYGIASGMSYLHLHNIIHRDLNPGNIFLDDYLFPKIGDFGLSTKSQNNNTMTFQSTAGMKGNPTYSSPEILQFNDYTKSGDVYAFGFVVFEILTAKIPFIGICNKNEIFNEVVTKCNRPEINKEMPDCYRNLIQRCWAQKSNERPSFDEIVLALRSDPGFITSKINKDNFINYVDFIDESRKSFDSNNKILNLDEFIREKSKIIENEGVIQKINENDEESNGNQKIIENESI